MAQLTIVEAVNAAILQEMERDEKVVVLGEDVGVDGGVFRATQGLFKKFGEKRVIDTPLSESGIVGVSIGLAANGFKPVAEIQFSGFMPPAFDQLSSHAARLRNRTRGKITCPIVVRMPSFGGIKAPEHHSESVESLLAQVPGLKVVVPSTPFDAKGLLVSAIRDPDPVMFLEPIKIYRSIKEDVPEQGYTIPLGKAKIARDGKDVTLVSFGAMMRPALEAAQIATQKNIGVEVIDLRSIAPLDIDTINESVKKTGRCVVVHEGPRMCGIGAEISALVTENDLLDLIAPVERVTGFDTVMPLAKNEQYYLPNAQRIVAGIEKVVNY
ncbi:MAG: alpha-ketoacid dehydrogenase subunit beta [archaeon]